MAERANGPAGFAGFGPRALGFFRALAFHQDKAWFDENRAIYEGEVKAPLEALLGDLSGALAAAGLPLRGDARSIFRLHRDVRFSKDKRPYKTTAGAVLSRDGSKRTQGFLYIHLDPEGCFSAAGFYRPEPDQLRALRRAIAADPDTFRAIAGTLGRAGLVLAEGEPLVRLPRDVGATGDPEVDAAIRKRSLYVQRPISPDALAGPSLVADILAFARQAEPLLRFGWRALGAAPDEG